MSSMEQEWIDTPGMNQVLKEFVPEAADFLKSKESYEPVLIVGPTGTGKNYIRDKTLSAAGIPKETVFQESFLFAEGVKRGVTRH